MNIQWYPGHMAKSRRLILEKLKIIDLIIEVVDARAPFSTKNPDFDQLFRQKKRILLLNKSDLAEPEITKAWVEYYKNQGIFAIAFCAMKDNPKDLNAAIQKELMPIIEKYRAKGMTKTVRCMAAGIPNVGKSALLNRVAGGGKKLKEGNKPGVTRGLQWLKLNNQIELLDSPGLMWPKIENQKQALNIALLKSINEDILNTEELALGLVNFFKTRYPDRLVQRYNLKEVSKPDDVILDEICRNRGFLMKGDEPDMGRAANMIIDEFQAGKLGRISLETPSDIEGAKR